MKRTLLLVALAIVLLGAGVGIYFFFFSTAPSITVGTDSLLPASSGVRNDTTAQTRTVQDVGVPLGGAGTEVAPRLIRISDAPVVFGSIAVFIPGKKIATSVSTTSPGTPAYSTDPDVSIS